MKLLILTLLSISIIGCAGQGGNAVPAPLATLTAVQGAITGTSAGIPSTAPLGCPTPPNQDANCVTP